jgi:hypothetical protein
MPQLDFFTVLFQFKSFFLIFFGMYFVFVLFLIPRLHYIIRLRRLQIINLLNYYFFLKIDSFFYFKNQIIYFKNSIKYYNKIYNILFNRFFFSYFSPSILLINISLFFVN